MGKRSEHFSRKGIDGQQVHEEILNIINDQENANKKPRQDVTSPFRVRYFQKTE